MNGFEFRISLEERLRAVAGEDAFWEAGHLLTYLEKNPGGYCHIPRRFFRLRTHSEGEEA